MSGSHAATARHWQRHVERWRNGELSKSGYCREHALTVSSFHRWVRRLSVQPPLGTSSAPSAPSPMTLIPVQLHESMSPAPDCVVARVGRLAISLPVSLDAERARIWLDALAQVR